MDAGSAALVIYGNTGRRVQITVRDLQMPEHVQLKKNAAFFAKQWDAVASFWYNRLLKESKLQKETKENLISLIEEDIERRWAKKKRESAINKKKKRIMVSDGPAGTPSSSILLTNVCPLEEFENMQDHEREELLTTLRSKIKTIIASEIIHSEVLIDNPQCPDSQRLKKETESKSPSESSESKEKAFDDRIAFTFELENASAAATAIAHLHGTQLNQRSLIFLCHLLHIVFEDLAAELSRCMSPVQMAVNIPALLTTVLSHVTLLSVFPLFISRKLVFELSSASFGLLASVMYHVCQSIDGPILLSESQWHRLDNVAVIANIGLLFVSCSAITDRFVEKITKYVVFFVALASQEPHPWDVRFTISPILLFLLIPVVQHLVIRRQLPMVHKKNLYYGIVLLAISAIFFYFGLDDDSDPYRIIHGMWHFLAGIASYYLWQVMKSPNLLAGVALLRILEICLLFFISFISFAIVYYYYFIVYLNEFLE
eukprot:gene11246-7814_t